MQGKVLKNQPARAYVPEGALCTFRNPENRKRSFLEAARDCGTILESTCLMCDCDTMQLTVELPDGLRGIIPHSEAAYQPDGSDVKDIAVITRVGKPIQFKLRDISCGEALLSRRAAQRECFESYISALSPGDIIPARVTHLEPFGAFCDIGCGLVSLLTVDKISVSRISHPSDRFRAGEYIDTVISSVEDGGRIYLSHRELLGTWEENAAGFSAGQTVTGIIRSVEDYGIFVELTPNLAGLAEVFEGAVPGEKCSVYIKSMIRDRMKIKLVLIDTCGRAEAVPPRYYITSEHGHIDRWVYSPEGAAKVIESVFAPSPVPAEMLR